MKTHWITCTLVFAVALTSLAIAGSDVKLDVAFRDRLAKIVEKAGDEPVVRGTDDWLYLANELRHVSVGKFWGDAAMEVSKASRDDRKDPAPAIIDFAAQLKAEGIELIFVPIPPKAVIYPEHITPDLAVPQGTRLDVVHKQFYDMLEEHGVNVLDLTPMFLKARGENDTAPLYCRTDTHYSPRACAFVAQILAEKIESKPWYKDVPKRDLKGAIDTLEINGDLRQMLGDESVPKETLTINIAYEGEDVVQPWRESPVLLVGDSHNLVFHIGGDMHAEGAGLADQLAAKLGFPVDVVGVRGSGATPSRIQLYRRKDNLAGKKVVIWCLSAREFTEGSGWWKFDLIKK